MTKKRFRMCLYGREKVGKSYFLTGLPGVCYMDSELVAIHGQYQRRLQEASGVYREDVTSLSDLRMFLNQMKMSRNHGLHTIVIDSITKLEQNEIAAEQELMAQKNQKEAFGSSRQPMIQLMRRLIAAITYLDMNVILVAHEKPEYADGKSVGFKPDCYEKIPYELDLCLRMLSRSSMSIVGSRLEALPQGNTFLPEAFLEGLRQEHPGFSEPAQEDARVTEEEVKNIEALFRLQGGPELVTRMRGMALSRAGVESFSEMSHNDIEALSKELSERIKNMASQKQKTN